MLQPKVLWKFFSILFCLIISEHCCKKTQLEEKLATHDGQPIGIQNPDTSSVNTKYSLFNKNPEKDVTQVSVCKQRGVSNCTGVTMNFQMLSNENNAVIHVPDIGNLVLDHTEEIYDILHLNYQNEEGTTAYITYYEMEQSLIGTFTFISGETRKLEKCGESCYIFYKVTEKKWTDEYDTDYRSYRKDSNENLVEHQNNEKVDKNSQSLSIESCLDTFNISAKNESLRFETANTEKNDSKTNSEIESKDIQLSKTLLQLKDQSDQTRKCELDKVMELKVIEGKLEECQGENMKNNDESKSSDSINIDASSLWSECSERCGNGIQTRNYTLADPDVLNQTVRIAKTCNLGDCLKASFDGDKTKLIIKENCSITVHGESDRQVKIGYFLMGGGGGGDIYCGGGSGFIEYGEDFHIEAKSEIFVIIGEGGKSGRQGKEGSHTRISAGIREVVAQGGNVAKFTQDGTQLKRANGWSGGGVASGGQGGSNGSHGGNGILQGRHGIMGGKGSEKTLPDNLPELSPGLGGKSKPKWVGGGGGGVLLNGYETKGLHEGVGQGYGGGGRRGYNGQNGIAILWIVD